MTTLCHRRAVWTRFPRVVFRRPDDSGCLNILRLSGLSDVVSTVTPEYLFGNVWLTFPIFIAFLQLFQHYRETSETFTAMAHLTFGWRALLLLCTLSLASAQTSGQSTRWFFPPACQNAQGTCCPAYNG